MEVERAIVEPDRVVASPRSDHVAPERAAQVGDVALQDVGCRLRCLVLPDVVDEPLGRHHLVGVAEQDRKHGALPRPAQAGGSAADPRFQRAEDVELEPVRCRGAHSRHYAAILARAPETEGAEALAPRRQSGPRPTDIPPSWTPPAGFASRPACVLQ